jgi:hypothetical protein
MTVSPGGTLMLDVANLIQFHGGKAQINFIESTGGISVNSMLASLTDAVAVINTLTSKVDSLESKVAELSRPVVQYEAQF